MRLPQFNTVFIILFCNECNTCQCYFWVLNITRLMKHKKQLSGVCTFSFSTVRANTWFLHIVKKCSFTLNLHRLSEKVAFEHGFKIYKFLIFGDFTTARLFLLSYKKHVAIIKLWNFSNTFYYAAEYIGQFCLTIMDKNCNNKKYYVNHRFYGV